MLGANLRANNYALQPRDRAIKFRTSAVVSPPKRFQTSAVLRISCPQPLGLDFAFDDCHERRPSTSLLLVHVAKVDREPVVSVLRVVIDFLAADVRHDYISVASILFYEPIHFADRRWHTTWV